MITTSLRTAVRLALAGVFVALVGLGATAVADTPSGWEDSPSESFLSYLIVLFLIPAGLFLVISTLVVLPSLVRRTSSSTELQRTD